MDSDSKTLDEIKSIADTNVRDCYQCGKCSAGCPVADQMDLQPNQLLHLVQMGHIERAMRSEAIWKCVSCMTCSTRCPKSVNCAGVIDALRQLASERGLVSDERKNMFLFQKTFLDSIRDNGRVCEIKLIGKFKTKAFFLDWNIFRLFRGATLAPKLATRGKLKLLGQKVRDRGIVRRIFERCER
jgi:heterodisulfide reductase subunit C2